LSICYRIYQIPRFASCHPRRLSARTQGFF
jgi:hypothetical protein